MDWGGVCVCDVGLDFLWSEGSDGNLCCAGLGLMMMMRLVVVTMVMMVIQSIRARDKASMSQQCSASEVRG